MHRTVTARSLALAVAILVAVPAARLAAQEEVTITPSRIAEGLYMLEGSGGNMGLSVGADGAFLIDDQFAPLTGKILAAVAGLTDEPVRFVLNTHWHGDHTGGNENLGKAGAVIVAHDNVRQRMSVGQFMEAFNRNVPAAPAGALPVITFNDEITFHWNGSTLHVFHVEHAHTDGDVIVHFREANVLHMGDVFFNGLYPFIDVASGGGIDGVIAAIDRVMPMLDEQTRLIAGHGPAGGIDELRAYRRMLATVRDAVKALIDTGLSRDEVIAAKPTRPFDERWGGGFLPPDQWTGIVYDSLVKRSSKAR